MLSTDQFVKQSQKQIEMQFSRLLLASFASLAALASLPSFASANDEIKGPVIGIDLGTTYRYIPPLDHLSLSFLTFPHSPPHLLSHA